ncbi:MAG: universal stress protein [Candidatus Limnocylindrales bacterium]
MYERILAAIDGSEPSTRAYREALRLAADQHAALRVAHVIDLGVALAPWADLAFLNYETLEGALRESGARILEGALAEAREAGIAAEAAALATDVGDPAGEILAEATRWGANLIVMGTHGRHGLAHLILGSVAEGVVQRATVPVLLLRATEGAGPAA